MSRHEQKAWGLRVRSQKNATSHRYAAAAAGPLAGAAGAGGVVTLEMEEYLKLLEKADSGDPYIPADYLVSKVAIFGAAGKDAVSLTVVADVQVLSVAKGWCTVDIAASSLALVDVNISRDGAAIDLGSSLAVTRADGRKSHGDGGFVAVRGSSYALVTRTTGLYSVRLELLAPYDDSHENSFKVGALPLSPLGTINFTVPQANASINVHPCLGVTEVPSGSSTPTTTIEASFPPTSNLKLNWTWIKAVTPTPVTTAAEEVGVEFPAEAVKEAKAASVTVDQATMFSVGEGVVSAVTKLDYTILHAGVTMFEVCIKGKARVVAVHGSNVRDWEVLSGDERGAGGSSGGGGSGPAEIAPLPPLMGGRSGPSKGKQPANESRVLQVMLNYPVEDRYTFNFVTEFDMSSKSCEITLPSFQCLGVAREKGFLAVSARTTVEIDQVSLGGSAVARVDVRELPSDLSSMSAEPPLLGYKFLVPNTVVTLHVQKHADVAVLVALVDEMLVDCSYTSEGKRMYHVLMRACNNDRQYIRLSAPDVTEVWTTSVDRAAVKPARDANGAFMIPIPKSGSDSFTAEMAFLTLADAVEPGATGSLEVPVPSVDLPVQSLHVRVFAPEIKDLEYDTDYEGNELREALSGWSVSSGLEYYSSDSGGDSVKVIPPKVGRLLKFERYLVDGTEGAVTLQIPYHPRSTGCC